MLSPKSHSMSGSLKYFDDQNIQVVSLGISSGCSAGSACPGGRVIGPSQNGIRLILMGGEV
jgi:hypothetical protein